MPPPVISPPVLIKAFHIRGFTLRSEARDFLLRLFRTDSSLVLDTIVSKICAYMTEVNQSLITTALINSALNQTANHINPESFFNFLDQSKAHYLEFDVISTSYNLIKSSNSKCIGSSDHLRSKYTNHYSLLSRSLELFGLKSSSEFRYNSKPIKLASVEKKGGQVVKTVGMLILTADATWQLEDPEKSVQLVIPEQVREREVHGFLSDGCWVIATGLYDIKDRVFVVSELQLPPVVPRLKLLSDVSVVTRRSLFGFSSATEEEIVNKSKGSSELSEMSLLVFIDVNLDVAGCVDKLIAALQRLNEAIVAGSHRHPFAIVLMGNFLKNYDSPFATGNFDVLSALMVSFFNQISVFSELFSKTKIVLIPGPKDVYIPESLPRLALPLNLQSAVKSTPVIGQQVIFLGSPGRLQLLDREIVFHRDDISTHLSRTTSVRPNQSLFVPSHLARTILSQGHLCPCPTIKRPINWKFDHELRLFPLPSILVLGDLYCGSMNEEIEGTRVVNSDGSFSKDSAFLTINPFRDVGNSFGCVEFNKFD
ncbi:hypothetical protein RCL1_001419 [Eukaryota sp. TZLM3-RCL]